MSVFTVDLQNQPGELARLCEAMAGRGVNLILCATTRGEDGTVAFIADDEASAETALADAGIGVHEASGADHQDGKPARRWRRHVPQARRRRRQRRPAGAGPRLR